jgi:acetyl-CoA acetyltransferase
MRPVHVAGFAQLPHVVKDVDHEEAEMVQKVVSAALTDAGVAKSDVGFVCSGSSDYVMGRPFSFTMAIDGLGIWPPMRESHVEMDGAWALYEAWVRLQHGDVDVAVVYAYGKASVGSWDAVRTLILDPYRVAPLRPPPDALAALQASAMIDAGVCSERDIAAIVARSRSSAAANPNALALDTLDVDTLLEAPTTYAPLRAHDAAAQADSAAAIVLTVGSGGPRIGGIAHRIDPMDFGVRDPLVARSARLAGEAAGATDIDVAELYTPYAHEELLLREALHLHDAQINPSGGALCAEAPMVAGLIRIGEAASAVNRGARRALGHATQGPWLQQNLVCVLEAS